MVVPGKVGTPFADYPVGLSAEAYLKIIENDEQFKKEKTVKVKAVKVDGEPSQGQGQGSSLGDHVLDDHSGWGDVDEETKAMAKERLKDAMEKAAKDASSGQGWGSVSADVRKQIMDAITPKIDWRKVLRYFIKTTT